MSVNIVKKIEKVYSQKKIKSITKKEDDFYQKFESDEDLKNLSTDQLKAYLKYYESKKDCWKNRYFPLMSSANLVLAGLLGGAFADFAKTKEGFIVPFCIISLFVILGLFCLINIVPRKENEICQYLSYIIANKTE